MTAYLKPPTYDRALQRATDERLEAAVVRMTYGIAVQVSHPDDPTGYYTVRWERGSRVLSCNCEAGRRGTYCKHRALAHDVLARWQEAHREARYAAQEQAAEIEAERRNSAYLDGHYRMPSMDEQIEDARDRWLESLR